MSHVEGVKPLDPVGSTSAESKKLHITYGTPYFDGTSGKWIYSSDNTLGRVFETGASRDTDDGKLDFEAFFSPLVLERYAEHMHAHRHLKDGTYRDGDNWQKGIPLREYMKSGWRHFMDWWRAYRGLPTIYNDDIETVICALIFNASGYLHEILKEKLNEKAGSQTSGS